MKYLKLFENLNKFCPKYDKALEEVEIFKNILQDLHDDNFHINYNIGLSNVSGIYSATEILKYDSPIGLGVRNQDEIEEYKKHTNNWIIRYPKSDVYYSLRIVCDKIIDEQNSNEFCWDDISNNIHHLIDEAKSMGYKDYVLGFYSSLRRTPKKYFDLDKLDQDNPKMYHILNIVVCKDINTIDAHYRDNLSI